MRLGPPVYCRERLTWGYFSLVKLPLPSCYLSKGAVSCVYLAGMGGLCRVENKIFKKLSCVYCTSSQLAVLVESTNVGTPGCMYGSIFILKVPCHAFPVITRPLVCYEGFYPCKRSAESKTLKVHPVGSKTLTQSFRVPKTPRWRFLISHCLLPGYRYVEIPSSHAQSYGHTLCQPFTKQSFPNLSAIHAGYVQGRALKNDAVVWTSGRFGYTTCKLFIHWCLYLWCLKQTRYLPRMFKWVNVFRAAKLGSRRNALRRPILTAL